jgi:hypothetical protein
LTGAFAMTMMGGEVRGLMDIHSAIHTLFDAIERSEVTGRIDDLAGFAARNNLNIPQDVLVRLRHHVGNVRPEHVPCPPGTTPQWECRPGQTAPNCFSFCA